MLMQSIEDRVFKSAAPQAIRHLSRPNLASQDPIVRSVFDQAAQEFQLAPPLTIHVFDPVLLAGFWHATREVYVVNRATRNIREAVAVAISKLNSCPYCATVHDGMFAAGGGDETSVPVLAAQTWASNTLSETQGTLDLPGADTIQIYGTAVLYHYLNRMVSVFLGDSPVHLPGMASNPGQKLAKTLFSAMGKRIARVDVKPGQSAVKSVAELPSAFAWAKDAPVIAEALAHFAHAAETAGLIAIPQDVRDVVLTHVSKWNGAQAPLSRAWIEDEIATLDDVMKPTARLCLLTIRAPWQVDDKLIADVRRYSPGDKSLVQTSAWAAFVAARHISGWFAPVTP